MLPRVFVLLVLSVWVTQASCHMKDTIAQSFLAKEVLVIDNPDSVFQYRWNDTTDSWNRLLRSNYTYNANGDKINEVLYIWYNNDWLASKNTDYIYHSDKLSQKVLKKWDDYYLVWENGEQYIYSFDTSNNLIQTQFYKWSVANSQWQSDSLFINEYSNSNRLQLSYIHKWSFFNNDWEKYSLIKYIHDSLGNVSSKIFSIWEFDLLIWEERFIENFTFYKDNKIFTHIQQKINNIHTAWLNNWKVEHTYYLSGLIQQDIFYIWSVYDNDWIKDYKIEYTYDSENRLKQKVGFFYDWDVLLWENHYQTMVTFNHNSTVKTITSSNFEFGNWQNIEKYVCYYPRYNSVNDLSIEGNLIIYPNPAKANLFIKLPTIVLGNVHVSIYDIYGKKVVSTDSYTEKESIEITLPFLPAGVYLLFVKGNAFEETRKVLINH